MLAQETQMTVDVFLRPALPNSGQGYSELKRVVELIDSSYAKSSAGDGRLRGLGRHEPIESFHPGFRRSLHLDPCLRRPATPQSSITSLSLAFGTDGGTTSPALPPAAILIE